MKFDSEMLEKYNHLKYMIDTLVGKINATGSSHIDNERIKNLNIYSELIVEMLENLLDEDKRTADSSEGSVFRSHVEARESLDLIFEKLHDYLPGSTRFGFAEEVAELQENYKAMLAKGFTKKELIELVTPFRDKYMLTDSNALRITRGETSLMETIALCKNRGEYTSWD